jgi:hypothetical protein
MLSSKRPTGEEGSTLHRMRPAPAAAVLAVATALAIAGCSSTTGPKPPPSTSPTNQGSAYEAYTKQLTVALVSCFYRLHLIPKSDVTGPPPLPVSHGRVAISTSADQSAIQLWFASIGGGLSVQGISMGEWLGNSPADPSDWPASKCGTIPKPSS